MIVIEGFEKAKKKLSRQVPSEFYPTSLTLELEPKNLLPRDNAELQVRQIIDSVREHGDSALLE